MIVLNLSKIGMDIKMKTEWIKGKGDIWYCNKCGWAVVSEHKPNEIYCQHCVKQKYQNAGYQMLLRKAIRKEKQ